MESYKRAAYVYPSTCATCAPDDLRYFQIYHQSTRQDASSADVTNCAWLSCFSLRPPFSPRCTEFGSGDRNNTRPHDASVSSGKDPQSGSNGRRPSLSGGPPPWAPAKAAAESEGGTSGIASTAASGTARRPSLSGGMPRWAPAPPKVAEDQGNNQKKEESESATEAEKPAESGVTVSDWLAAAAGAAPGEVSGRVLGGERAKFFSITTVCLVRVGVHVPCRGEAGRSAFSRIITRDGCYFPPTHLLEYTHLFIFRARRWIRMYLSAIAASCPTHPSSNQALT